MSTNPNNNECSQQQKQQQQQQQIVVEMATVGTIQRECANECSQQQRKPQQHKLLRKWQPLNPTQENSPTTTTEMIRKWQPTSTTNAPTTNVVQMATTEFNTRASRQQQQKCCKNGNH